MIWVVSFETAFFICALSKILPWMNAPGVLPGEKSGGKRTEFSLSRTPRAFI